MSNNITGDISEFDNIGNLLEFTKLSQPVTSMSVPLDEKQIRYKKKQQLLSILDNDDELLQEVVSELRKKKINDLKDKLK